MESGFINRFGAVSRDYATYRPGYPSGLFQYLASIAPARSLAWDCATGSGQAAVDLAGRFDHVIATDASHEQIAGARPCANVEYRVATAECSGLASKSVDLITVAQALHWFDVAQFFRECDRVLVRDGVLAIWTYGPLHLDGDSVDAIVSEFEEIVHPYWPPERALVDSGYKSVVLPGPDIDVPEFEMTAAWTLGTLLGYFGTWSSTQSYRETNGVDPRDLVAPALRAAWGNSATPRGVTWKLSIRATRKHSV